MGSEEFPWKSEDNIQFYARAWQPPTPAKGVLVLIHGLGEHISRYEHVAEFLNANGYALIGIDLRGHGRTEGKRGYASYAQIMDDISLLVEEARKRNPGIPCFLYGHSMGGSLVLYYLMTRKPELKGAVVTSPGLMPYAPVPKAKQLLGKVMRNIYPQLAMPNGLDVNYLSHDPKVIEAYRSDPLVHGVTSAALGIDLLQSGLWMLSNAGELKTPVLLMQGGVDGIIDPVASRRFAETAGDIVTFKLWDGLYHELHNELQKAEVLSYMVGWLDAMC